MLHVISASNESNIIIIKLFYHLENIGNKSRTFFSRKISKMNLWNYSDRILIDENLADERRR
jgi:hypothetical protein